MTVQPSDVIDVEPVDDQLPEPEPDQAEGGAVAVADQSGPGTALDAVPSLLPDGVGTIPTGAELQDLAQMAVTFAASDLVPKALKGKPNDVMLVLMTARDLGLAVTVALRECHPIDGRVTVSPKLKLATVRQQGLGRCWPDPANDSGSATWYAQRAEDPEITYQSTYSWEQAQRAGMVKKGCQPDAHKQGCSCKSNWKMYPERMLSWRAVGYLLDDVFGEVGTGLYSPDELGAMMDEDGHVVLDVAEVPPITGLQSGARPRRAAAKPAEVASETDRRHLREALEALPPEGLAAAKALWATSHLGPLDELPAKKVRRAEAVVDSITKRAAAGEWGDWSPTSRDTRQDQPVAASDADPAPTDPEPATGDPGGQDDYYLPCSVDGCVDLAVMLTDDGVAYCDGHAPLQ